MNELGTYLGVRMDLAYAVAAVASSLAAVLAWVAKIWWGREYAAAKDAEIKAKDAHAAVLEREIDSLRELTPMRIREYFVSMRSQLEEYNAFLQGQLESAGKDIHEKEVAIAELRRAGSQQGERIAELETQKHAIEVAAGRLERQVTELQVRPKLEEAVVFKFPQINLEAFRGAQESSLQLQNLTRNLLANSLTPQFKSFQMSQMVNADQLRRIGEALAQMKFDTQLGEDGKK